MIITRHREAAGILVEPIPNVTRTTRPWQSGTKLLPGILWVFSPFTNLAYGKLSSVPYHSPLISLILINENGGGGLVHTGEPGPVGVPPRKDHPSLAWG